MSPHRDPISVRTTRLNNLILSKGNAAAVAAITKASSRRSLSGVAATISAATAEAINRESLLDALCLLYNECDNEALKKRDKNIAEFVNKYRTIIEETSRLRVNADDFNVKTLIGKGYFGNVHLVVERQTGDVYAMKKIKKSIVTTSQVREERDIMSRRCCEWITNLQYAFQDNETLYLVMEFLPGGDLLSLMSRHGPFDEDLARFYLAELTLAIHSLHQMGYIHRDIKPENILIDRFGHIKLADFGNAAAMDRDGHVFSLSPVGTPDYIAPELLQTISTYKLTRSLHDVSCDYWSMGIIGYELICEVTPFHEDNVHETYSKILSHCEDSHLKEVITFPNECKVSNNFKNLIESLITNPTNRLTYDKIRKHSYFETVKWDTLRSQVPPIIPTVESDDDTSNFEDVARNKGCRTSTFVKKSLTTNMRSNDFSGKDLPYVGYSFVHMEKQMSSDSDAATADDVRLAKLNALKIKDLQSKLKERTEEIGKLKQNLLRNEQVAKHSDAQSKLLQDAKEEIQKMKNMIKEKTVELAACKTLIKTLQSSVKIEEEMWEKKESTITELLRKNRQKYEEAKITSEQRYEKLIAEKKHELASIAQRLDARESELNAKVEECAHLQEKMQNYKDMLHQCKEQAQTDKADFERNKNKLTETYEQKLLELRSRLKEEKASKSRLTMELKDVRTELNDSICSSKSTEEAKNATAKNNDEILKRLNREIQANNELHTKNAELTEELRSVQHTAQDLQQDIQRLERELKLAECSKNLAESTLAQQSQSPYETAPGSLTELRSIEQQLRNDLETAKDGENAQRMRAEKLEELVHKLEQMMDKFNESMSPSKPHPAPRHGGAAAAVAAVDDMLEKQNEKLEERLVVVREQMVVERQAARTANLALWKTEKKLEEAVAEKKMIQRRMELTEERIKKQQTERDEAQRLMKAAQDEVTQREQRIQELRDEIAALKRDVFKEHKMWEKSEQERMQAKSEVIQHISNVHKLEERVSELRQKLQQTQQKCDALGLENNRLVRELNEEREKQSTAADRASELQMQLKNLQDNYASLKYACTITDNQLTEVEGMFEAEQKRNKTQQEKIDALYASVREKDEHISQLKRDLQDGQLQKKQSEQSARLMSDEIFEHKSNLEELQKKLISQQQQLMELTTNLFEAQERIELLSNDAANLHTLNENNERELSILKEENARILSDLFHAKEEVHRLQSELKEAHGNIDDLHADCNELQNVLAEKENFYLQRDIKSEATLAQHKKLIDYLQLKVEDFSQQKKKKTLTDMIFGTGSSTAKKENISPGAVESSILYRALQEELRREKQRCKSLQEQLDKLNAADDAGGNLKAHFNGGGSIRSPLKAIASQQQSNDDNKQVDTIKSLNKSPKKCSTTTTTGHHRFELALQETNKAADNCIACSKPIIAGSPYWRCKECKEMAHRKCRNDVNTSCSGGGGGVVNGKGSSNGIEPTAPAETDSDATSLGKYSYEGKLDTVDCGGAPSGSDDNQLSREDAYVGKFVLDVSNCNVPQMFEVNCAYEMEELKILLLGCNCGLYAYHMHTQQLVHIAGIDSVNYIAISVSLAKAILIGSLGESLYQCDFRHLMSRSQANACLKPALEASVLDLPFANRASSEKWQLVKISNETENALDSVAIAATSTRIVILKYDIKMQKFKPVRALDTATPVSAILYTRHTAIVSSDKFFEIDLSTYGAEEFVDFSDQSLSHTRTCQPVAAVCISKQEFLLCFMECGVFVDEYGCRSRPYDLNWEYTPTGFLYREPFLYISHFQSVQILRLHRSYTKELGGGGVDDDTDDAAPAFKRVYLPCYMPTLLAESGKINAYALVIRKDSGAQQVYYVDALEAFKQKLNESLETISSVATSITIGSVNTTDSI